MALLPITRITNLVFFVPLILSVLYSCGNLSQEYHIHEVEIPPGYTHEQKVELSARVLPHPGQMKWWEDEFSGFIHYGPNTYSGREWGTGFEDAALFNPGDLDTDQWCELMEAAGISRVIMVVKHHEGYCLWQTRYTDHQVSSSPWRNGQGDVLRELSESCKKYGLRLGVYLSPADLYQIESPGGYYGNSSVFIERIIPRKVEGRPFEDGRTFKYVVDDYNEYFLNQLFELLTEYGPIYEVWFDGANPKPGTGQTYKYDAWFEMIRELAPDAVIFGGSDIRWCGNEGGRTRDAEYNVIPMPMARNSSENIAGRDMITAETEYFRYFPAETNTSIRGGWFWRNDHEQQVRSVEDVFDIYERTVGGNSVFLLNIPPNTEGKFPPRDAEVLVELGRMIETVYGTNLISDGRASNRNVLDGNTDTWWQAPSGKASLEVILPEKRRVNRFMIREAIAHRSERVEEHYLEARVDGSWIKVAEGKTIGHKRILRFSPVDADAFRLYITKSRLEPSIAHISAHYYDEPPKPVVVERDAEGMLNMGVGLSFSWKQEIISDRSQDIYYTLNGSEPSASSESYQEPFPMPLGGYIRARAIVEGRKGTVSNIRLGILRTGWTASDSEGRTEEPERVLDGNTRSLWLSGEALLPGTHSLTIDMQQEHAISGFSYLPPAGGGFIEAFDVEISHDGEIWEKIYSGSFGNIVNDPGLRTIFFDSGYETRFLRLSNLKPPGGMTRVGAAEIEIFSPGDNEDDIN